MYNIKIEQDLDPMNPRKECDNLGTLICFHRRYSIGDKSDYVSGNFASFDDLKNAIIKTENPAVILPVFMYDHSGITINTTGFSCPWDSGQIGFIFVSRDQVKKEYGWKRLSKKRLSKIEQYLNGEIETYNQYLKGDVFGFIIEDESGEHVDSCWGFYGYEYCKTEAEAIVKNILASEANDKAELQHTKLVDKT